MRRQVQVSNRRQGAGEAFAIIGIFAVVIILLVVLSIVGYALGWIGEAADVAQEQFGARNAVRQYEWFKNQYELIQAADQKIAQTEAQLKQLKEDLGPDRKEWSMFDAQEYDRLSSVLLGQRNYRQTLVADYNAHSKMANRSVFRTNDLPETIE